MARSKKMRKLDQQRLKNVFEYITSTRRFFTTDDLWAALGVVSDVPRSTAIGRVVQTAHRNGMVRLVTYVESAIRRGQGGPERIGLWEVV